MIIFLTCFSIGLFFSTIYLGCEIDKNIKMLEKQKTRIDFHRDIISEIREDFYKHRDKINDRFIELYDYLDIKRVEKHIDLVKRKKNG